MKTIYKYEIPLQDHFTLELPKNAEILTVQAQFNKPQLWAIVDIGSNKTMILEKRYFKIRGTGHNFDDVIALRKYIGTFQIENGELVFHLFEIYKEKEVTLSKKGIKKIKEALKDIGEGRVVKV